MTLALATALAAGCAGSRTMDPRAAESSRRSESLEKKAAAVEEWIRRAGPLEALPEVGDVEFGPHGLSFRATVRNTTGSRLCVWHGGAGPAITTDLWRAGAWRVARIGGPDCAYGLTRERIWIQPGESIVVRGNLPMDYGPARARTEFWDEDGHVSSVVLAVRPD